MSVGAVVWVVLSHVVQPVQRMVRASKVGCEAQMVSLKVTHAGPRQRVRTCLVTTHLSACMHMFRLLMRIYYDFASSAPRHSLSQADSI
jgi:hypothetical protein